MNPSARIHAALERDRIDANVTDLNDALNGVDRVKHGYFAGQVPVIRLPLSLRAALMSYGPWSKMYVGQAACT